MNYLQMKTALKRFGFDDDDPLLIWLNAGLHSVEQELNWPWLIKTTALSVGTTGIVDLPPDFAKVVSLKVPGKWKLNEIDRHYYDREIVDQTVQGIPESYVLLGMVTGMMTLKLYPIPDVIYDLQLTYLTGLSDMVGTDLEIPNVPANLHWGIVLAAASIALQAENEEDRAQSAQAQYASWIGRAIAHYNKSTADSPGQVVDTMGYSDVC